MKKVERSTHNMTNSISIEHDYRKDIVERKRDKDYWRNWDSWNILYKTLAYEIHSSGDVESYSYVRESLSIFYDKKLVSYVGIDYTFDLMNGWWQCFKMLFNLKARDTEKTKRFIDKMMKDIVCFKEKEELKEFISKKYPLKVETVETLLSFLEVVYTCGNFVPVPKGENKRADDWDSWEYKLKPSFLHYKCDDYNEYFYFNEYLSNEIFQMDKSNKETSICQYMSTRVELIKNRGKALIRRLNDN